MDVGAPTLPASVDLHPAIATWFAERFPQGPTEPQALGWPLVRAGTDVLVAAPTGSGKTLAGFLMAINEAYLAHQAGEDVGGGTRVVYVSPLKALAVDVHHNLERPLAEIAQVAERLGLPVAPVTVAVRTGDTPSAARAAMVKGPPTILVTTPESLYLYLTADRSRRTLSRARTVIVDEIHALARDKRGSHLALSLERLDHAQLGPRPQRVGLSATQRPIELTASLLAGSGAEVHVTGEQACRPSPPPRSGTGRGPRRRVEVVDCGHRRDMRLSIEVPEQELAAVLSQEQLDELVQMIAARVRGHRTTLVFVNTRRLSERLAHLLGEVLGPDQVAAHHGSLSAERRKRTEARLRAGELRALVATASLELGIDVGPVDLACQVGSPRSISTFLQRVGRSNHSRHGVPEGALYPTTRDELVECAALLRAVHRGRLDRVVAPVAPLDVLAQQVVAEVAAVEEQAEDELFELYSQAGPYAGLSRDDFDAVVALASEGIATGHGHRMAFLHRDRVNGVLRPRRGARLAALTSGGAIPELGDYRVVAEPDELFVGTVNEDFAIESSVGDVFLLGTHSWRVKRVGAGEVRVLDAQGAPPTVPFWVGEAPSRTVELSEEVSRLRSDVAAWLGSDGLGQAAGRLAADCGLSPAAADQVVRYLATGLAQLGRLPTGEQLVFERFFDEAGGMQLVVHSPFGGRVNRALGLALRKRFCVTFDFELQAAASDDAVLLSLGPQHSFPLSSAPQLLHPGTVRSVLEQAVLTSPMFASRWRWDLSRALAILRFRGGRKNPLPVQRMEADDLMAAIFPALAACQENTPPGPVTLPDHVLVRQVVEDCLHEAMDLDGLVELVEGLRSGRVRAHFVDSVEPSVLAHEILGSKPYTYLDDAPLEERRSRQVQVRRGLPVQAQDLALSPEALHRARDEVAPAPRSPDELHELLLSCVVLKVRPQWAPWLADLVAHGRAVQAVAPGGGDGPAACATERREQAEVLLPGVVFEPGHRLVPRGPAGVPAPVLDEVVTAALRGHLGLSGAVTVDHLADELCVRASTVAIGLARLEAEGFAFQGQFDPGVGAGPQWCARHLLARAHRYSREHLRRQAQPVSARELMRFLLRWQHVAPGSQLQGRAGTLAVVGQLQGWELAAGAWDDPVLSQRVESYQRRWLEDLCLAGQVGWGRLSPRPAETGPAGRRGTATPSRATPVTFFLRQDLDWLMSAKRSGTAPEPPEHGPGREVFEVLGARGAMFASDLASATGRLPSEVDEGLWDLVARGLVTSDGFGAVRSLFSGRTGWARHRGAERGRAPGRPLGSRRTLRPAGEGRWSLLAPPSGTGALLPVDELAELVANQLLARWGVVFWDLVHQEDLSVPWREVLWALRRFEARGTVHGGRFVNGFAGEQYALPEAVEELSRVRQAKAGGEIVRLSATDPLNLTGVLLPGRRVPALRTNSIVLRDGLPLEGPLPNEAPA